jgi:membrane protease subunit HflK
VSITGIQKVTSSVGWYAITPEQELAGTEPPMGSSLTPGFDGSTLTADSNVIHTRATVTYRIEDPIRYVFGFVDASNAVQSAVDNALLFAASRYKVDNILTRDVIGFSELVRKRLVELVAENRLGIQVEQCTVQSVPPRQLKDAFANVLKSEVNRNKALVEARSYENQTLTRASADVSSRINTARSDRARLVAEISSRADQFQRLLPGYRDNPEVFVMRRLTETLGRVLTNVQDKIFVPESVDGKSRELRYLFNREPKLKPEEPKR